MEAFTKNLRAGRERHPGIRAVVDELREVAKAVSLELDLAGPAVTRAR